MLRQFAVESVPNEVTDTIKGSRVNEMRVFAIMKQPQSGTAAVDMCREHGISSATSCKWKAGFGGLAVSDARRLKAPGNENAKLRKPWAEQMSGSAMLRDVESKMVSPAARRVAVAHLCEVHQLSRRRAVAIAAP